jgi:protein involved in polysaccharide export with SLBB domain
VKRADNQVTVTAGELSATLGSLNAKGAVAALDADGNVRLKPGDTVRIKLAGFKPGSIVEAWLFSTPQLLGTAKVGADGIVVGTFTIPKNISQGSHRIAVVAQTVDGKPATLAVGIKVGEWKKEKSIAIWLIILPIVAAVFGALFLPAVIRRRRHNEA